MSIRLDRFSEAVKEEISNLLRDELDPSEYGWISVTAVKVSKDLKEAHVFVTVFPEHLEEKALKKLNQMAGYIRKYLSKRIRAKTVPSLRFELDTLTKMVERGMIKPPEGDKG
jgi:ribosome-binding factor A